MGMYGGRDCGVSLDEGGVRMNRPRSEPRKAERQVSIRMFCVFSSKQAVRSYPVRPVS